MRPITLEEFIYIIDGVFKGTSNYLSEPILGINPNGRDIRSGELFWRHFPYNISYDILKMAFNNGCVAHICLEKNYREYMKNYPTVIIKSTDEASMRLTKELRPRMQNKIISVGGSLGKTSTTDMISSVLSTKYRIVKTTPHNNTPETIFPALYKLYLEDNAIGIFEMCLDPKGKYTGIAPDYIVLTNISSNHSDIYGGIEGIYYAKTKIIQSSKHDAKVFLWSHDEWLSKCQISPPKEIIWLGNTDDVTYTVKNYKSNGLYGGSFIIKTPNSHFTVFCKYPGIHFGQICLTASAIGEYFELDQNDMISGISNCTFSYPRSQIFDDKFFCFSETYNLRKNNICNYIDMLNNTKTEKEKVFITGGFHVDSTDIQQIKYDTVALGRHVASVNCVTIFSGINAQSFAEGYNFVNSKSGKITDSVFDLPDSIQQFVKSNSLVCVAGNSSDEEGLQNVNSIIKRHNHNLKKSNMFPCLYGNNYALLDRCGNIVEGYGENESIVQHSVAPLITSILAIEEGLLDKIITVNNKINYGEFFGAISKIKRGDSLSIRDMVYTIMFSRANDLCYLISKQIPDYYSKVANFLSRLKCCKTKILAPYASHENYSTAFETAKILWYCLLNHEFKKLFHENIYYFSTKSGKYEFCNTLKGVAEGASIGFSHYYENEEGANEYIRWQVSAVCDVDGFVFAEGNFLTYEQQNTLRIIDDINRIRQYCISLLAK